MPISLAGVADLPTPRVRHLRTMIVSSKKDGIGHPFDSGSSLCY